jgi:hypothetical protein
MKLTASLFPFFSLILFFFLNLEPVLLHTRIEEKKTCCKNKCLPRKDNEKKDDCANQRCNPFVPCSMGSCCYLVENFYSPSFLLQVRKDKPLACSDNIIPGTFGECWHPPENLS